MLVPHTHPASQRDLYTPCIPEAGQCCQTCGPGGARPCLSENQSIAGMISVRVKSVLLWGLYRANYHPLQPNNTYSFNFQLNLRMLC